MIPKILIRFRYNFFHVFRKIGTISILSKYNHFISTNRRKQWNNHFITDFIFIYRFLTGLTPMSIINRYQTDIYLDLTPIYTIIRYETDINTDFILIYVLVSDLFIFRHWYWIRVPQSRFQKIFTKKRFYFDIHIGFRPIYFGHWCWIRVPQSQFQSILFYFIGIISILGMENTRNIFLNCWESVSFRYCEWKILAVFLKATKTGII